MSEVDPHIIVIEVERLKAVMRLLVESGDMTPMAVRQIKAALGIGRG